ncbi:4029_t:CDS:1 [Paraglomus brasilianum]|uniref:4029_t:CDS:1 n=1 Tax=Paraglomus brasilianum TaxID=144538 RepID=A0A9N9FKE7_9GLOM|nr:4029_t:CDS:1 [Paraglomus brasilianum]
MAHNDSLSLPTFDKFNKLALDGPIYDVVVEDGNGNGHFKETLHKGSVFRNWEEAFDTINMYARQEGFKLRKAALRKLPMELYENEQYFACTAASTNPETRN